MYCRMQDQLIIFMAVAQGTSTLTCGQPDLHTRTAAVIAEQLTDSKFRFKEPSKGSGMYTVTCEGAGICRV